MKEKFLPIGTVVLLEGATKKIMIIGYCPMGNDNKVFDYSACTYPEGLISSDKTLAFNHNQIKQIVFMGLESEEQQNFSKQIKNMLNNIDSLKNVELPNDDVQTQSLDSNVSTLDV